MLSEMHPGVLIVGDDPGRVKEHVAVLGYKELLYASVLVANDLNDRMDREQLDFYLNGLKDTGPYLLKPRKNVAAEVYMLAQRAPISPVDMGRLETAVRGVFVKTFGWHFLIRNFDTIIVAYDDDPPFYIWNKVEPDRRTTLVAPCDDLALKALYPDGAPQIDWGKPVRF